MEEGRSEGEKVGGKESEVRREKNQAGEKWKKEKREGGAHL